MQRIGSILPKVLRKRGMLQHVQASMVVASARAWLAKEAPAIVEDDAVMIFRDNILVIPVPTSAALMSLSMKKDGLLAFLRAEYHDMISDVRVQRI